MSDSTTNAVKAPAACAHPLWHSLVGGALALAVTVALLALGSAIVYPKNNSAEAGMYDDWVFGILAEPKDSIDVIFLGDSEVYTSLEPRRIWSEQGFTSYACGTSAQRMYYGYSILKRVTRDQSPRVVVIETNELFRKFSISSSMLQVAKDVFPVFEYHDRWRRLTSEDFTFEYQATQFDLQKGFMPKRRVEAAEDDAYEEDEDMLGHIPRLNKYYLNAMIDYCRSIGAVPVLVTVPSIVNWTSARHKAVQRFADESGVDYIDMNVDDTKVDINWETETADGGDHVNYLGAAKVTSFMGAYLAEHYDLPDHRGDPSYTSWE